MATNNAINLGRGTFSAILSADVGNVTGTGSYTVLCDTVLVDEASAYNAGTGTYTAPYTGNYLFNATVTLGNITALATLNCSPSLMIGGVPYSLAINNLANVATPSSLATLGGSIIFPLTAGTTVQMYVYVTGEAGHTIGIKGRASYGVTAFSGCLLL